MRGNITILGAQTLGASTAGAGTNRIRIDGLNQMSGTISAKQFGNAFVAGDWQGKWVAKLAGVGNTLSYGTTSGTPTTTPGRLPSYGRSCEELGFQIFFFG